MLMTNARRRESLIIDSAPLSSPPPPRVYRITVYLHQLLHLSGMYKMATRSSHSLALGLVVEIPSAPQTLE
jgi:hypothetical protein